MRQEALRLAALGMSYSRVGKLLGLSKGSVCEWMRSEGGMSKEVRGQVLELDGLWAHTRSGRVELKVLRDEQGAVELSFEGWEQVISRLYERGLQMPQHVVSDGDVVIAQALGLVYGPAAPHQLCQFHLLREYRRHFGSCGWAQAKALLGSSSQTEAAALAEQVLELTKGRADYWCRRALHEGLAFLATGHYRLKTTSLLERLQRELRRRERLGSRWSFHNLISLLSISLSLSSPT